MCTWSRCVRADGFGEAAKRRSNNTGSEHDGARVGRGGMISTLMFMSARHFGLKRHCVECSNIMVLSWCCRCTRGPSMESDLR